MTDRIGINQNLSVSHKLYATEAVREWEAKAAKQAGVAMYTLMERAGMAVFRRLQRTFSGARRLVVLAGGGNNGGDAYVVARLAHQEGYHVQLCAFGDADKLSEDAARARQAWLEVGGEELSWPVSLASVDVIVDGLLGTGVKGTVRAPLDDVIDTVNQARANVISIDLPSGLNAETGHAAGAAIQATMTVTLVGIKPGLVTGEGRQLVGELHFNGLGISDAFDDMAPTYGHWLSARDLLPLPKRAINSHKNHFGRVLCVGGNESMGGAIRLAAQAALRTGSGPVKVFCHRASSQAIQTACAELMVTAEPRRLDELLAWADTVVLGPGLGQDDWARTVFLRVINQLSNDQHALVLDADGLNLWADHRDLTLPEASVITPHPGEAARVLSTSGAAISENRWSAVQQLRDQGVGAAILKGAGSLIATRGGELTACRDGNPGMATPGMGDVLTGVIAGLLAQGLHCEDAALYGCLWHSRVADRCAESGGQRGMMASDVLEFLREVVNS